MYGITQLDLKISQAKLDRQREYLSNFKFVNSLGIERSMLDISMGANFSSKYYAEISNRVNTMASFSIDYEFSPVFLTITLNGCFRDALNADFSRFKRQDMRFLPSNIKRKIDMRLNFSIRDLIDILNHQWNLFIMRYRRKFKNSNSSYIRCFEPHVKDGVPHIHALFYAPKDTFGYMLKIYKDIFNAPQNLRVNAISKEQIANGEINGFQTSISNPSGYVMKYIQKTFINSNTTDKLDELSAWYVKHKVRRFLSSRSSVPLWVYRKINFISTFKDFYHLNDFKNDPEFVLEWSRKDDYISINLPSREEELIYLNGRLEHYICGKLRNVYDRQIPDYKASNRISLSRYIHNSDELKEIKEYYNQHYLNFYIKKKLGSMKDWQLYSYYRDLDKESANIEHLVYIENLIYDRGFGGAIGLYRKHDISNIDYTNFYDRGVLYCPF